MTTDNLVLLWAVQGDCLRIYKAKHAVPRGSDKEGVS